MTWFERYRRWLHVLETGGGWFVERDGRRVALLTDPRYVDMFWYAWHVEPLGDDAHQRAAVLSPAYWEALPLDRTAFISREYGVVAAAFWPIRNPLRDGRLVMRGLYQPVRDPWPWDRVLLWVRRKWR